MSNEEIFGIINYVNSLSFSEFEMETKDLKLRISRASVAVPNNPCEASVQNKTLENEPTALPDVPTIVSPISGTYYQASAPGSAPFVTIGSNVQKGDTLCIIEAMKMMLEVKAEKDGVIKAVEGKDGEPVNEGAVLFVLEGD